MQLPFFLFVGVKGGESQMAIHEYEKGSKIRLSKDFHSGEFDCKGKGCCSRTLVDPKLVEYLQMIRDHFHAPVVLNSGYRCQNHNVSVGGVKKSRHCAGMAADIRVKGHKPVEVARFAEQIGIPGIGLYETDKDGHFVHIDTREKSNYWYGQAQKHRDTFQTEEKCSIHLRTLFKSSRGDDVAAMQYLLMGRGYSCGDAGADGIFGSGTESALRQYQQDIEKPMNGIVDKEIWCMLLGVDDNE